MSNSGERPSAGEDVRDVLAQAPDLPAAEVVDLISRDQERHWRQGVRVLLETYLAATPATRDPDVRLDLIYAEILLRESFSEHPEPAEYVFRFPDLADQIRTQFQLHRTLLNDSVIPKPSPTAEPMPAQKFAHHVPGYEILGVLGSGAMGIIYKARHCGLGRTVALKVLRPDLWAGEDAQPRLRREAEALARVQHPHIVQIYEVGVTSADQPYLALEYVSGGTLADRLRDGPMRVREAVETVQAVALAIHAAHEVGLVHRDLKPANILLAVAGGRKKEDGDRGAGKEKMTLPSPPSPVPKVTDFGLVKRLDRSDLSRTGELLGTPSYVAPEQAAGKKNIGPPADVYALGAILYEGLTGRPPFQGENPIAVLTQAASAEPVPPSRFRPTVSRDLEAVVLKCLEKTAVRRYPTAAALADDLGRYLAGQPTRARPLTVAGWVYKLVRRHPLPAGLLALVAVSLVGGLAGVLWQWQQAVRAREHLHVVLRAEEGQRRRVEQSLYLSRISQATLLWESGQATQARDLLATCEPGSGIHEQRSWEWHYLNRLFHSEALVLPLPDWVNGLALCPPASDRSDELAVAVGQPELIRAREPAPGGGAAGFLRVIQPPEAFRPGPPLPGDACAVAVQPGQTLVAWGTTSGQVILGDRSSGRLVRTIELPSSVTNLCFAEDGWRLIVSGKDMRLRVLNPATGEQVAEHLLGVDARRALAVQPSGSLIAAGDSASGRLKVFDLTTGRLVADLTPRRVEAGGVLAVAFSPNGRRLATAWGSGAIVVWESGEWGEVLQLRERVGRFHVLAFHPDGRKLATGGVDRAVRLWDLTTGQLAAVYRGHDADILSLAFGRRGAWLASGSKDQTVRIWDTAHDPRGRLLRYRLRQDTMEFDPTPAGLTVRPLNLEGKVQAWVMRDGRGLLQTEPPLRNRSEPPIRHTALLAGRRVALICKDDPCRVAVWTPDPSQPPALLPAGGGPVQSVAADPRGSCLVWATPTTEGTVALRRWDVGTEVGVDLARLNALAVRALAFDPKGRWLIAVTTLAQAKPGRAVWAIDLAGWNEPRELVGALLPVVGLAFDPRGQELAVAAGDTVQLYQMGTWELRRQFSCLSPAIGLAYSEDGRRLAAVSDDGVVTLADPFAGKSLFQLHSMTGVRPSDVAGHASVAFDGDWMISTNWDGSLNLWNRVETEPIQWLPRPVRTSASTSAASVPAK
jgi:serine/threonine protein kinase/WD40 repeat protein